MANKKLNEKLLNEKLLLPQQAVLAKGGEMMMKSRKGSALIIALVVVLMSGIVVAAVFHMAFNHASMSVHLRNTYVDHTTLRSAVEQMKGLIFADNMAAGEMHHVAVVIPRDPELIITNADQLRFSPQTAVPPASNWSVNTVVMTGAGPQRLVVDVYDMAFIPGQLDNPDPSAVHPLIRPYGVGRYAFFFPPHIFLEPELIAGGGGGLMGNVMGGTIEGGATAPDAGESSQFDVDPAFGAYLIRARLFEGANPDINTERPLRIIEEAFVQVF